MLVITGAYHPTTFSYEVGGIVYKIGPGVSGLKPSDKIVGFHSDKFVSYQRVPASILCKLETKDNLEETVRVMIAYTSVLYAI